MTLRRSIRLLFAHLQVGYIGLLLLVDALPLALWARDSVMFAEHGYSVEAAFRQIPYEVHGRANAVAIAVLFFLVVLPICVGIINVISATQRRITRVLVHNSVTVLAIHVLLSCWFATYVCLGPAMETISGGDFQPWIKVFSEWTAGFTSMASTVSCLLILPIVVGWVLEGVRLPQPILRYELRLKLARSGRELLPLYSKRVLSFNAAAVAPQIKAIQESADAICRQYQLCIPGSKEGGAFLEGLAQDCRKKIVKLFFPHERLERLRIHFYPSTSRALEIALLKLSGGGTVILSPFEHPTERAVARWIERTTGRRIAIIEWGGAALRQTWSEQQSALCNQVAQIAAHCQEPSVLVISEVAYATGAHLKVNHVADELAKRRINVRVVVDGAHTIGNVIPAVDLQKAKAIVFSAHKWLLAAEPCGILVSRDTRVSSVVPYDEWGNNLPVSTAGVQMIANLNAALNVYERYGVAMLQKRAASGRAHFVKSLGKALQVVGENQGLGTSLIASVAPGPDRRWIEGEPSALRQLLETKGISAELITNCDEPPWVRMAFPYFLDIAAINRAALLLKEMTTAR